MIMQNTFGSVAAYRESFLVATLMLVVTVVYQAAMALVIPEFAVNYYEFFGTWCVLNAVWLARTQNIQTWVWGIVGVILLGVFFGQMGLPGQQWLQWAFFVPIQVWSWYYWATAGSQTTTQSLPITVLSGAARAVWLVAIATGTVAVVYFIDVFAPGSNYPWLDALVVTASMTAQYLMGRKKVESWLLWLGPVNVVSVVLFYLSGAYVLTALYIAFLVHAGFGVRTWWLATKNT